MNHIQIMRRRKVIKDQVENNTTGIQANRLVIIIVTVLLSILILVVGIRMENKVKDLDSCSAMLYEHLTHLKNPKGVSYK